MNHASRTALATIVAIAFLVPAPAAGQSAAAGEAAGSEEWTLPRTADGRPDLQGYWTTQTFTPIERPEHLGEQEFFSEEEAAALQEQLTAEGVDPLRRDALDIADAEVREEALYQENRDRVVRPLRQPGLAAHAGAEGPVEPAHVAAHVSRGTGGSRPTRRRPPSA